MLFSLPVLAGFLADVPAAWQTATLEQRNKLARVLFDEIWLKDKEVVFVKPRPELDPFFRRNNQEYSRRKNVEGATSAGLGLGTRPSLSSVVMPTNWRNMKLELFVSNRKEWRSWLRNNHAKAKEIWIICFKKNTGKPSINYTDSVEEASCFGWIDGLKKSIDEQKDAYRFMPRKSGSK